MRSPVRASILPDRRRATASGDPVGWETGRWPLASSYRAHPRLYRNAHPTLVRVNRLAQHCRPADYSNGARLGIGNKTCPPRRATQKRKFIMALGGAAAG